ncbi:MAG: tetratricopeptide repeat protein [Candidatus Nitrosopolaris sp.]
MTLPELGFIPSAEVRSRIISIINRGANSMSFKLMIVCILAILTVIGLSLILGLLPHVKAENNVVSGNSSLLVKEGIALDESGNYTGAIEYYDKALAIDPHNVNALRNKGLALDNSGNYTGAVQYYDKALAIDPHYVKALNGKGNAFYQLGNYTAAIVYYDKALAIDPHEVSTLANKGNALDELGMLEL